MSDFLAWTSCPECGSGDIEQREVVPQRPTKVRIYLRCGDCGEKSGKLEILHDTERIEHEPE